MKEFPGVYPRPRRQVDQEEIRRALDAHDYATVVDGISTITWHLGEGDEASLVALYDAIAALPPEWTAEPEVKLPSCWEKINAGHYTEALLIMDQLVTRWKAELDGQRATEAANWILYIRGAQGVIYERWGQLALAHQTYTDARCYLPMVNKGPIRAAAILEIDPEEAERLLTCDPTGFCALLLEQLPVYQASGDRRGLAQLANNLGHHYLERGELAGARYWLERALELKSAYKGRLPITFTLEGLGTCYQQLGLLDKAQPLLDELLRIATDLPSPFHQAHALSSLGNVYRDRDELETAQALYGRSLQLKERLHDSVGMANTELEIAALYRRQANYPLAGQSLAKAKAHSFGIGDPILRESIDLHSRIITLLMDCTDSAADMATVVQRLSELHAYREETLARWYLALAYQRFGDTAGMLSELHAATELAATHCHLAMLAAEIPVTVSLWEPLVTQGINPKAIVGMVQCASPRGLALLLERVPASRAVVEAANRLEEASGLTVKMFGTFRVFRAGVELDLASSRSQKAISLLKLLVAQRKQVIRREQILDAIWPDVDYEAADRSFDVTLSTLRKLLDFAGGPAFIVRRGRGYSVNPQFGLSVDVEQFLAHWERGHWWLQRGQTAPALAEWQAAEELYIGDFLSEDFYDDWTTTDRENLREKYLELMIRLGDGALQEGHFDAAIDRAHRVLAIDPLRETAYRLLMRAHTRLGDRAVALRDFRRCEETLFRELGEEPMVETRDLAQEIRSGKII